jgi:dihydrolipoamide dehydrogenase
MVDRKDAVVRTLVGGVKFLINANRVEFIEGEGKFFAPSHVQVGLKEGPKRDLKARKIIIATGSRCKKSRLKSSGKVIDTTEALNLKELPKSIVIAGGGFVGVTFATIFAKLGSRVTLVEESAHILPQIDKEIISTVKSELQRNGIKLYSDAIIEKTEEVKTGAITVQIQAKGKPERIEANFMLVADSRQACLDGLGLDRMEMTLNSKGGIMTNAKMETNIPSILAAGDVTMEHMWTPVAYIEGITAADNAMGLNKEVAYGAIPFWISTVPEIAAVGMTEEEAREKGYDVRVGRFPFAANGMATILGQRAGMVKIVVDERYHQILGLHIVGPGATDLIAGAGLAIRLDVTPEDIGATLHAHPSLSEAVWEAARDVTGEAIHFMAYR